MSGSSSGTCSAGLVGVVSLRRKRNNSGRLVAANAFLPVKSFVKHETERVDVALDG